MGNFIATENIKDLDNPKIYFDANIWMFNYCVLGRYSEEKQKLYSSAYLTVLNKRFTIYTSFTTISEFINRYLRLAGYEYKAAFNIEPYDYKRDFRGTDQFTNALDDVKKFVRKILKYSTVINCVHSNDSLMSFLNDSDETIDFNDQEIVSLCKQEGLHLLTDDGDFADVNISVISSNQRYFQR